MKYIYIFLLTIFSVTALEAQQSSIMEQLSKIKEGQSQELDLSTVKSAAKATNAFRVIALKWEDNNSGVYENGDSLFLTYSGDRGGDIFIEINYDVLSSYSWDGFIYNNDGRGSRTYNANDKVLEELDETWDGAVWINNYRTVYTYDANDNQLTRTSQNWNTTGNNWENTSRTVSTYTNNLKETETYQNWDGTSWVNSSRSVYTYNSNGDVATQLAQQYNSGNWDNNFRTINTYNANDLLSVELIQDYIGGNWEDDYRNSFSYDANGNMINQTYQNWNGSTWNNSSRYLYEFNTNDERTKYTSQNYTTAWENNFKEEYSYDGNGNMTLATGYSWDGTIWDATGRAKLYYESYVGIPVIGSSTDHVIYPNPFQDNINFSFPANEEYEQVNIYDLTGKLIHTEKIGGKDRVEIDGSNIDQGIYFYQLEGIGRTVSGKIIKQ